MRPFLLIIFFSLLSDPFCYGQHSDADTLKKLNHDWLNAYPTRDTAALSKILADDFILVSSDGIKQDKKDNLLNLLNPAVETISVSFDSVDVRILSPTTGVLTAWASFVFKTNGKQKTGRNCYQDVYIKRNGRWLAVTAHVTSLGVQ